MHTKTLLAWRLCEYASLRSGFLRAEHREAELGTLWDPLSGIIEDVTDTDQIVFLGQAGVAVWLQILPPPLAPATHCTHRRWHTWRCSSAQKHILMSCIKHPEVDMQFSVCGINISDRCCCWKKLMLNKVCQGLSLLCRAKWNSERGWLPIWAASHQIHIAWSPDKDHYWSCFSIWLLWWFLTAPCHRLHYPWAPFPLLASIISPHQASKASHPLIDRSVYFSESHPMQVAIVYCAYWDALTLAAT